jgi:hypothetical protein
MSDMKDWNTWNQNIIAEFRASQGRGGGKSRGPADDPRQSPRP